MLIPQEINGQPFRLRRLSVQFLVSFHLCCCKAFGRLLIGCCLSGPIAFAQQIETEDYQIALSPTAPTTLDIISVNFTKKDTAECGLNYRGSYIDVENRVAKIAVLPGMQQFGLCVGPTSFSFLLGRLFSPSTWSITVYETSELEPAPLFSPATEIGELLVSVALPTSNFGHANPETPQEGSIQSGIGAVRGWACSAQNVHIQFDDNPLIEVAYGTDRQDTVAICGDAKNGYGMVVNWGALSPGLHRMSTYINYQLVREVEFEVVGLGEEFVKGLSGTYMLEDFPGPGQSTTVQWSEPDQEFNIIMVE